MNQNDKFFEVNRATWNQKVQEHIASDFYNLEAFKGGQSSLNLYELEALNEVSGKSLLHLQCHFGQDTLSWSRLGAQCVGLDLSDEGIKKAQQLNAELGLDVQFVCCNVLDTSKFVTQQFDIVFTSYGVIGWLPDLKSWGIQIAERLKKDGVFYMVEFHPIVWMFDYLGGLPKLKYGYMQDAVIYEEYEGTYGNTESKMISKEYGWNHGLGAVVTALAEAGLHIEFLREHYESPYNVLPDLIQTNSGMFVTKDKLYPLIFEIKATKL